MKYQMMHILAASGLAVGCFLLPISNGFSQDVASDVAKAPASAQAAGVLSDVDYAILPEPLSFAKERYARAQALNAQAPSSARTTAIMEFVDSLVNYDEMAVRALGARWDTMTAEKQSLFQKTFQELARLTYVKKFSDKSFKDKYNVEWDRVVKKPTTATVSCFTQQKDVETEFEIILHASDKAWKVYDVLVDGASLTDTYRKKYDKKIEERGIDGIIADMQKEIAELKKG